MKRNKGRCKLQVSGCRSLDLDRRFCGLGPLGREKLSHGEIFRDAFLVLPKPEREIDLIPNIGGG